MLSVWFCLSQQKQNLYIAVKKNNWKNHNSCPFWNPSRIPGDERWDIIMRSIIISILLKGTVRNLAQRQCEIRTKTNLINLQTNCPSPKKANQQTVYKSKVMEEASLLLSVCLWLCWLVVCLQTDSESELNNAFGKQHKYFCCSASWMLNNLLIFSWWIFTHTDAFIGLSAPA